MLIFNNLELDLLVEFLDELSERFSNDSANSFSKDLSQYKFIELLNFQQSYEKYDKRCNPDGYEKDLNFNLIEKKYLSCFNWQLVEYLKDKIKQSRI